MVVCLLRFGVPVDTIGAVGADDGTVQIMDGGTGPLEMNHGECEEQKCGERMSVAQGIMRRCGFDDWWFAGFLIFHGNINDLTRSRISCFLHMIKRDR